MGNKKGFIIAFITGFFLISSIHSYDTNDSLGKNIHRVLIVDH
jgi:hypothetical protein